MFFFSSFYIRTLPSSAGNGRWLIGDETATGSSCFLLPLDDDDADRIKFKVLARETVLTVANRPPAVI